MDLIDEHMDIKELRKLIKSSTSVLIMEQGDPDMVVMDYQAYKRMAHAAAEKPPVADTPDTEDISQDLFRSDRTSQPLDLDSPMQSREAEVLERLNREIMILKEQIEAEEEKGGFSQ